MNAGKTTALLQTAYNYEEQGNTVELFTSEIDDRYGVGKITSRLGLQRDCQVFDKKMDFEEALLGTTAACILIDEAEFLTPEQVSQLHRVAQLQDVPIICYGLRTDFQGNPFKGSAYLMCLADTVEELKTTCTCGKRATMNIRLDDEGNRVHQGKQTLIGGNNRYRQICARCFYLGLVSEAETVAEPQQLEG